MLTSFRNMFKVPDLRNKILFTLLIIAFYRFGSHVPTPGIDFQAVQQLEDQAKQGGVLGFLNLFSGGALTRFAIFGLGIMPYITSSIIMQVLAVVIPKLEQWQQQGAVGQKKITQWTRYLTVALAILQSTGLAFLFHNGGGGLLRRPQRRPHPRLHRAPGDADRAVAHRRHRPAHVDGRAHHPARHRQRHVAADLQLGGQHASPSRAAPSGPRSGNLVFALVILLAICVLVAIVFVEQGQRRIPVQFAKRVVGRRMYGGQSHLHPAQGQPVRRHPDHLRQLGALPAGAAHQRAAHQGWGDAIRGVHRRQPAAARQLHLHHRSTG